MDGRELIPPVVLFTYNRPKLTRRALHALRQVRPRKLLVVADGPRQGDRDDDQSCRASRAALDLVDWPCEVQTDFAEVNLGCARRVSSGLDWAFSREGELIILEDDCVPHPDFFRFCGTLLERYRTAGQVFSIAGTNFQPRWRSYEHSYYFSRYTHCWGWASWRRAWKHFDFEMSKWPLFKEQGHLNEVLEDRSAVRYWERIFEDVRAGIIDSWAYRWTFAAWVHGGLTALPAVNLVSNVGFGVHATHTRGTSRFSAMPVQGLAFPLRHPHTIARDGSADRYTEKTMFSRSFWGRLADSLTGMIGSRDARIKGVVDVAEP